MELLGTVPQKPDCKQNCGDGIKAGASKKMPVVGITACHPSYDCGGDTIQQCGNDTNDSNENHKFTPLDIELNSREYLLLCIQYNKQDNQAMVRFLP